MANEFDVVAGFAPSSLFGQNNAGLNIYISPGSINGVSVFAGGTFSVSPSSITFFWCNSSGAINAGPMLPAAGMSLPDAGIFPIAQVFAGLINTWTNPPVKQNGITSLVDIRPTGAFSFGVGGGNPVNFQAGAGLDVANTVPGLVQYSMAGGVRAAVGSNSGSYYSTTSNSLVDVDATNLVFSLPNALVGYRWVVTVTGNVIVPANAFGQISLTALGSLSGEGPWNIGNARAWFNTGSGGYQGAFAFQLTAGPTTTTTYTTLELALQYSTSAGTLQIDNGENGSICTMVAQLMPTI